MAKVRVIPPAEPMERREHFDEVLQVPFRPPNGNGDAFPVKFLDYPDVFKPFTHHRDKMKPLYERIKRLALMAPPVLTQAMVPEGRSFAMAKTNEEVFRRQVRGETKELKILEPEAPVKECIAMNKGDEAQLMDETGKKVMGRIIYAGEGKFKLKEDPTDVKIGRWFWALAGNHRLIGDPRVCYAEVDYFQAEHTRDGVEIDVWMRMENGAEFCCQPEDLFQTQEDAEAARMKILEEGL